MTRNNFSKLKSFLLILLALVLSVSLCFTVACSKPNESNNNTKDENYTKVEKDEQELTNGNFEFGTVLVEGKDFPYTSTNGWTRSTDNSAQSSKVNSGIVSTDADTFKLTIENLAEKNSTFKAWALDKFSIDEDTVRNDLSTANPTWDDEKLDEETAIKINELIATAFGNPSVPTGVTGKKIYMLNNYVDANNGIGTAQKVTSSKTFTLSKNGYGKFTVWVNTAHVKSANVLDNGANIRVTSTVASVTQGDYAISSINTNGAWAKYEIFVEGSEFADTTLKLSLGLGYGNGSSVFAENYAEGTVYFDECAFEEIEKADYKTALGSNTADKIGFYKSSNTERIESQSIANNQAFLSFTSSYFDSYALVDSEFNGAITSSNSGASAMPQGATASHVVNTDNVKINLNKASYTLNFNSSKFALDGESYALVKFTVDTTFNKYARSGMTAYVFDTFNGATNHVTAFDNVMINDGESQDFTIIVKNNFDFARTFWLSLVFGPANVTTTTDATYYLTGEATISNVTINNGSLDAETYNDDTATDATDENNEYFYNVFSLASSTTTNTFTTPIHADYTADFTEENENTNYTFKEGYSSLGTITHKASPVANYNGIADYKKTYTQNATNNNAGVINTANITNYSYTDIASALASTYTSEKNIQPLMIYNETATNYGFTSASRTIAANGYETISIKVRVVGNATAYVYLVNTAKGDDLLNVLSLDFTADDATVYSNKLYLSVTADDMDTNGWATLKFYVATGKDAISYRIEMWNGERYSEGETVTGSQGYVFFDELTFGTSFDETGVLNEAEKELITEADKIYYTRKLDEVEIEYNSKQTNESDKVSYSAGVVWADNFDQDNNGTFLYAIYKTINPTAIDPNKAPAEDEKAPATGCQDVDASTFWLSLSSILLGVALVVAMVMLLVKKLKNKFVRRKSDAKSHYKVTSRNKALASAKATKKAKPAEEIVSENDEFDTDEETVEETEEYTYGDVLEDFSDEETTDAEQAEEVTQEDVEQAIEDSKEVATEETTDDGLDDEDDK